jgi:hypothetical protein
MICLRVARPSVFELGGSSIIGVFEAGAIILAGGRSTRMGSPKAALGWHGSTLLRRVTGIVARSVDGPVVVVSAPGQALPALDGTVESGAAIAIPTGGMLPAGADAVVMIEHTQEATADTVEVVRPVAPGENVVTFDEDVAAGAAIAPQGRPLRAQDLALLSAAGVVEVAVHAAPRVAILATGDEVVPPAAGRSSPCPERSTRRSPAISRALPAAWISSRCALATTVSRSRSSGPRRCCRS